jgi:hypothetical protein
MYVVAKENSIIMVYIWKLGNLLKTHGLNNMQVILVEIHTNRNSSVCSLHSRGQWNHKSNIYLLSNFAN